MKLPTQHKEKNKSKKKKALLLILLYITSFLFIIWLLVLLFLTSFFPRDKMKENSLSERLSSISDYKMDSFKDLSSLLNPPDNIIDSPDDEAFDRINEPDIPLEHVDRDDYGPAMKDILRDRSFDNDRFDAMFKNMKSPIIPKDSWHSTFGKDVIYIYHTHNRESFLPYFNNTDNPENAFHTKANITLVGKMLGRALERRGVGAKVDSTDIVQELNLRGVDYTNSYKVSGEMVRSARVENKDLEIFLDVHRDSLRKNSTTKVIDGESFARLLFVIGTGHENYEKNLSFTEGLDQRLSSVYPGLSKGILKKDGSQGNGVYNQDISPNSVIVEIGGVDNTVEELHRTTEALAEVLSDYYWHREK